MKWLSAANFVLGAWLIVAPFALSYGTARIAVYEDIILGVLIASLALSRIVGPESSLMATVSLVVAMGGLWVLVAPYLFRYITVTSAFCNDTLVGSAVFAIALCRGMSGIPCDEPGMAAQD